MQAHSCCTDSSVEIVRLRSNHDPLIELRRRRQASWTWVTSSLLIHFTSAILLLLTLFAHHFSVHVLFFLYWFPVANREYHSWAFTSAIATRTTHPQGQIVASIVTIHLFFNEFILIILTPTFSTETTHGNSLFLALQSKDMNTCIRWTGDSPLSSGVRDWLFEGCSPFHPVQLGEVPVPPQTLCVSAKCSSRHKVSYTATTNSILSIYLCEISDFI